MPLLFLVQTIDKGNVKPLISTYLSCMAVNELV